MEELTPKQAIFLSHYLTPLTVKEAAEKTGIDESTARRWLKLEYVLEEYRNRRNEFLDSAVNGLLNLTSKSRRELDETLDDTKASRYVKVKASEAVYTLCLEYYKVKDIQEKLESFESILKEKGFL